jgi:hypothetical protein
MPFAHAMERIPARPTGDQRVELELPLERTVDISDHLFVGKRHGLSRAHQVNGRRGRRRAWRGRLVAA